MEDHHHHHEFAGTDRFELVQRLGEGAMGVVYRALDRERESEIAVKTLRDMDAESLLRFKNEFRSLQGLQHPNLVNLGELIENSGRWFFTMELVDGRDFHRYVRPRLASASERDDFADEDTASLADTRRPHTRCDITRLRAALPQLVDGLAAMHAAGFVHRDVKPSNIMVSRGGRVVVLDFGFVIGVSQHSSDRIVGTAVYMAPEQAASLPVTPAADWYAVGAVVYEALTGRPPIDGMPIEVLMQKQHRAPPPPSAIVSGVPEDLEELCMALLAIRPERRPGVDAIRARLGGERLVPDLPSGSFSLKPGHFVGREDELERLERALQTTESGEAAAVFIHGESGIGKSALVRQFCRQAKRRDSKLVVFESRCHERESVPYKAFDGIIDAISNFLVETDPVEAAMVMPLHIGYLVQVFPVLRQSELVNKAIQPGRGPDIDPAERRSRVFGAFRELLSRLATQRPILLVIDDFQWADADSHLMLRALLRPPEPPNILLVCTVRDGSARRSVKPVESGRMDLDLESVDHLRLQGLRAQEASALARYLVDRVSPDLGKAAVSIAQESNGHPLFIDEMIRYGAAVGSAPAALHLDSALWARIQTLEPKARELVEIVAVTSAPITKQAAARALALPFENFSKWVSMLRVANLIQTSGVRKSDRITVFHDRVRQAVTRNLTPSRRRQLHERIALALESVGDGAAESLFEHWNGAGNRDKAFDYLLLAAEQATAALAFDRAASLYRKSLDFLEPGSPALRDQRLRLAHALADAGRSAEAANVYITAASEAPEDQAQRCRALAATHMLRAGHVDSALELLRNLLRPLGMKLPRSQRAALASLIRHRVAIRLGGLRFKEKRESEVSPSELERIDLSWAIAVGFGLIDTIRGAEFSGRHLRLALKTGEPFRVARALSVEYGFRSASGHKKVADADKVLDKARALASRIDHPSLYGSQYLMEGIGHACRGQWPEAETMLLKAEHYIRDNCAGMGWEISSARLLSLWAQWYQGKIGILADRVPAIIREARERGDLYASTSAQYFKAMLCLAADDPARARKCVSSALTRWSQQGFHFQHYCAFYANVQVSLYETDADAAVGQIEAAWPALKGSMLLSVQEQKIEAIHLAGRAYAARALRGDSAAATQLERHVSMLRGESCPWSDGLALLLEAAVKRGDRDECAATLGRAEDTLAAAGVGLFAIAARYMRGALLAEAGTELLRAASRELEKQRVVSPARMSAMLVPGIVEN